MDIKQIASKDIQGLFRSDAQYGGSWMRRGGIGAFMMLARKWDRIAQRMTKYPDSNILKAIEEDQRAEGIIDDIRDLRRYLLLVAALWIGGEENYIKCLGDVSSSDIESAGKSESWDFWKMNWNSLETVVRKFNYDIFKSPVKAECQYLRIQLLLIEEEFIKIGINPKHRDNQ